MSTSRINSDADNKFIVDGDWLADHLQDSNIRLLDGTYFLADKTRDPRQECVDEHIPGAQFFDITQIADTESEWPNTVPAASSFAAAISEMGIGNEHHVIAYDRLGLFSAARIWWLFRYFGHQKVSLLDGGLPKWKASGHPVEGGAVSFPATRYQAVAHPELYRSAEDVLEASNTQAEQIVDVRGANRFAGDAPEPRAGLRSGHIPGSLNLPFQLLLNDDHSFKSPEEISQILQDTGIRLDQPVITSCGSGVTACIVTLALHHIGHNNNAMFDGSWTEWGSRAEFPVATEKPNS